MKDNSVTDFLATTSTMSRRTAKEYAIRMNSFRKFVLFHYGEHITIDNHTYDDNVKASLEGNIWTEIAKNPLSWIITDSKMKSAYKAHQYDYEVTIKHDNEEQRERLTSYL
jgi:hypothetical protein